MLGRYDQLRLHPFSVGELVRIEMGKVGSPVPPPASTADWLSRSETHPKLREIWDRLDKRSGFPAPYFRDDHLAQARWSMRRRDQVLREDIRDLTQIRMLTGVEELAELMPSRVSGLFSINSVRVELQVAFDTAKSGSDFGTSLLLLSPATLF